MLASVMLASKLASFMDVFFQLFHTTVMRERIERTPIERTFTAILRTKILYCILQ